MRRTPLLACLIGTPGVLFLKVAQHMTTLKIASGFRRVILACALPATVLLATPAFPTEPTPEQRYPNHERDIAWIPATSDFHRGRDFAGVPGVVVAHAPKGTGICLGSPSLVVLPNGTYVASHDLFGKKWAERDGTSMLIYQSKDKGKTWACVSRVNNQNWSKLFWHQGALYIMG